MAHPYHHAVSSARQFGGVPEDYQAIHDWFDATKAVMPDQRHRALRHHMEGIHACEQVFGVTISLSTCAKCGVHKDEHWTKNGDEDAHVFTAKQVPVRWVGEQHVKEDLGRLVTAEHWLREMPLRPWMMRSRKLSKELEAEDNRKVGDVPSANIEAFTAVPHSGRRCRGFSVLRSD